MSVADINRAAFEGDIGVLNELLSKVGGTNYDKLVDPQDSNRGPLHFGVLGKKFDVVRALLERYEFSPLQLDEVIDAKGILINLLFLGWMESSSYCRCSWKCRNS